MASVTDPAHAKTFTTSDGTKYGYLFYPAQPGKDTVLLLHGFCSSVYDWRRVIPGLAKSGAGILAPDLLGYGDTDAPDDPAAYRMKLMTQQVHDLVIHEGLAKVVGVAHDWGCGLLSHMWAFCPELFLTLTFISLGYFPAEPVNLDAANAAARDKFGYEMFGYWEYFNSEESVKQIEDNFQTFQHLGTPVDHDSIKYTFAATGGIHKWILESPLPLADFANPEELAVHRKIIVEGHGLRGPLNWYRAMMRGVNQADHDALTKAQKTVTIPTLFIATAGDRICIPDMMRAIMRPYVPQWDEVETEAGHWVTLSHPEQVVQAVERFAHL